MMGGFKIKYCDTGIKVKGFSRHGLCFCLEGVILNIHPALGTSVGLPLTFVLKQDIERVQKLL